MTDIDIANAAERLHIKEIAARLNVEKKDLEYYGKYKAKLPLYLIDDEKIKKSKLILVTALTPTPTGEGKTTVSIGLADGLSAIGKKTVAVLREPSLGPVFGIKGGATGGGQSQILPMEDINLHFNGDFNAVEKAHNLLAAVIDNHIHFSSKKMRDGEPCADLMIDPRTVVWKRVMDMNDRALRHCVVGVGGASYGVPRDAGFDITAASEVMAILCLSENIADLRNRLGNIYVGRTFTGRAVYARDLHVEGAMTALLREAIKPNLVQTMAHTPTLVHGGPFANIAQGTNTIIATKMGLSLADYVVTEAGFGSDLGAEKFFDIKCAAGKLRPNAVVIVATVRALKYHGGIKKEDLNSENVDAVNNGMHNLIHHVRNMKKFGLNPIVAVNRFTTDTEAEHRAVIDACARENTKAVVADVWGQGGLGAVDLAHAVAEEAESGRSEFHTLYRWDEEIRTKIDRVAREIYGADEVLYSAAALRDIARAEELGIGRGAVCIAKTQYSFTDDPKQKGKLGSFPLHVRNVEIAAGAGFVVPLTGEMMRMPGLPLHPAAEIISIDDDGHISGLS